MSPITNVMGQEIETWVTPRELEALADAARDKLCLEMGAWYGASTVALASTAKLLVSVDWHNGDEQAGQMDTLWMYMQNVRSLENVVPIIGRFETALPLLRPQFQLVFIDGYHEYDAVRQDALVAARLAPRGLLAFHDWGIFEVEAAVSDLGWRIHDQVDSLAFFRPRDRRRR